MPVADFQLQTPDFEDDDNDIEHPVTETIRSLTVQMIRRSDGKS